MNKSALSPGHDGDCSIYASLINDSPECGICTCGYGWGLVRKGDWSAMYSKELQAKLERKAKRLRLKIRSKGLLAKLRVKNVPRSAL